MTTGGTRNGAGEGRRRRARVAAAAGTVAVAAGLAGAASPSHAVVPGPNGQIAFESNRDGNTEIYVMNSDGSIERNLTNHPANDFYPVWGPAGDKILFGSARGAATTPANAVDVWVMDADGSNPVQLTAGPGEDRGASFTSDGQKIVFHTQRFRDATHAFDLMIMDADGGNETLLFPNASAAYACGDSATGTVVFNSSGNPLGTNPERDFEIFTIDIGGGNPRQLTFNAVLDSGPKFSPDCSAVSYNSLDAGGSLDVHRMDADGTGDVNLTNAPGVFDAFSAFSPDGQRIVFSTNRDVNFEIYTMSSVDGSGLVRYTETKRGEGDLRGDWGTAADYHGPPTSKDQCRKDRWTEFGSMFADEPECVSFVASGSVVNDA